MRANRVCLCGAVAVVGVLAGCQSPGPAQRAAPANQDLQTLTEWMSGSFSSAEQSARDPVNYFDIRLHMVPIWTDRDDGPWLYVEQAAVRDLERPYRQRVYHLVARPDGTIASVVYVLPGDPLRFAGAWRQPQRLGELSPDDLALRAGCELILRRQADGTFAGSTVNENCPSTLRDAAYATSEATVSATALVTWDRGFDENGQQVWGAVEGGYIFKRQPVP